MFCPNCGKEIKQTDKFCAYCGNKNNSINTGKLTINRRNRFVGCVMDIEILIDKERVGVLGNGKEISLNVPIGSHILILDSGYGITEQEISLTEQCPNIYMDIEIGFGAFSNKVNIINVRKER